MLTIYCTKIDTLRLIESEKSPIHTDRGNVTEKMGKGTSANKAVYSITAISYSIPLENSIAFSRPPV